MKRAKAKNRLNKQDLAAAVTHRCGVHRTRVDKVFLALEWVLSREIAAGAEITFFGLGKFKVERQAPRIARNLNTNEPMTVPARNKVVFKPSPMLRKVV